MQYPGGLAARYRWAGSASAASVFGVSEATGTLADYGTLEGGDPDRLCRAELRVESPLGSWTARLASLVYDEPQGVLWDSAGLLLVKYGFRLYAFSARSGELAWSHASATPTLAVFASSRLGHCLLQSEVETIALRPNGDVAWRAAHNEVVTEARLLGGRLILTTYGGQQLVLDAATGRAAVEQR
ncbi:MAG: hypothetical protein M3N29_10360 [Chloroflexota bacterium]|nr:hypothetical protein [Chloroflexota bacterium]